MLWTAQMRGFAAAIARLPNARALDGEYFFAEPGRAVKLAADHLCVPMTDDEIETIRAGPLFATYSKDPKVPFNNDMRLERRSELARTLAPELDEAERWVADRGDVGHALQVIAEAALQRDGA